MRRKERMSTKTFVMPIIFKKRKPDLGHAKEGKQIIND